MSISKRQDEADLWAAFGPGAICSYPREAGERLGIAPGRVNYLCEKWARQGVYDYGVAADLGWKSHSTDEDHTNGSQ